MSKRITVPAGQFWDPDKEEFVYTKEQTLTLEHSLLSIKRWESKWHKPFLSNKPKTIEETVDYIRCMTLTQNVDPRVFYALSQENVNEINAYIEDPMTATWFSKSAQRKSREVVTSEVIYYWMIKLGIPFECEKWHFNQLMTLIKVCNEKDAPKKKMSRSAILSRNNELNRARRQAMHSSG